MTSYSDLRLRAVVFINEWAQLNQQVLILAPVREAADEIAFEACPKALTGVYRFSFQDLIHVVSGQKLDELQLAPTNRIVREALAARITAEALDQAELGYLREVATFPGFPHALSETLEELRLNRVSAIQVKACGQSGPDLATLLHRYEHELQTRHLADYATRMDYANELVAQGKHQFAGLPLLLFDIHPRTVSERDFAQSLKRWAKESLDLRLTSRKQSDAPTSLHALQQNLRTQGTGTPKPLDNSFEILSASGEALECVEIARRAGKAAAAGIPFDQMAILLRSSEHYEPLVTEALRRAGIPAHYTRGANRPDPAGRSFLALLHCAGEGLSASRFAEYMSLGQMPEGTEPKSPAAWERLLVDAAVIGSHHRWKARLAGLREDLHRRYQASEDEQTKDYLERNIAAIESLTEFALPRIQRLADLPRTATWGEWIRHLSDLATETLRAPERILELLDEFLPMSEIGPITLNSVLQVLGGHLRSLRRRTSDTRFGKIFVGAIEDARGLSFHTVFIPGVNEGQFPRPPAEDPLLLKTQREPLSIELRPDDKDLLITATSCASQCLVMSFSRLDLLSGRSRVPSFYLFDAYRAAGGPDLDVRGGHGWASTGTETKVGWPAPKLASEAIDDTEFDLAALFDRKKGSGQYLKRLPGRAVESLRTRWYRWHRTWKSADGLIVERIGNDPLLAYRQTARKLSPSALEQYARCPYRFALRSVFGLRPAERPQEIQRVPPSTRGEIYHRAQFELLRDLKERQLLPIDSRNLPAILDRLNAVMAEVVRQAKLEISPAIPQIWDAEMIAIRTDLRGWLQYRAAAEPDWSPEYFELSFGLQQDVDNHDPQSTAEPVELPGGFLLSGSIDLVERHKTGMLRVVDHKTGKMPQSKPEMTGGGEALQPALYAMAAEALLKTPVDSGRLFYSTIAQNYSIVDIPLTEWTRSRATQVLQTIDDALRKGFLPAAPRKDGCIQCEYLPVCGPYEEDRVAIKTQPELRALKELRATK